MWFCRKVVKVVYIQEMDAYNWIQFEDDFFEVKEKKLIDDNVKFNPVMCHPKWFFNDKQSETAERLQQQANFCYWTKDFNKAVSLYNKALENYFSNSPFMRRNLLESIARCYFHIGDLPKAQALAEECLPMSYTVELKTSILNLLCAVYKSQSLLEQEKATLLQLISLHPQNYRVWLDLAQCLSELSKRDGSHLVVLMEAACYLRISLLISAMKNNEGVPTLDMANKKLHCMDLPENFYTAGKKFFSQDLLEEHLAVKPKDLTRPDEGDSPEGIKEANDMDMKTDLIPMVLFLHRLPYFDGQFVNHLSEWLRDTPRRHWTWPSNHWQKQKSIPDGKPNNLHQLYLPGKQRISVQCIV